MHFNTACIDCQIHNQYEIARAQNRGEEVNRAFLEEVLRIILDAPKDVAAAYLSAEFAPLYKKYFDIDDPYVMIKRESNDLMLERLPTMREMVRTASDPLAMALRLSRMGNYMDYANLEADVIHRKMETALETVAETPLDPEEYRQFCRDLESARTLFLIADNAGELVADLLLLETIREIYPHIRFVCGVRGGNAHNDATREDAAYVGMDKIAAIVDSGSRIPGTQLNYCSEEFLSVFRSANVIISKGQANFECLSGCGANVYYLLLSKCRMLCELMQVPQFTGLFLNERRLPV